MIKNAYRVAPASQGCGEGETNENMRIREGEQGVPMVLREGATSEKQHQNNRLHARAMSREAARKSRLFKH